MTDEDVRSPIHAALRRLVIATVALYLVLAVLGAFAFGVVTHQRQDLETIAISTNDALCTLRADLERRIADSAQFLVDHPNGIQGITALAIQQGIDNQQKTVDALDELDCDGG